MSTHRPPENPTLGLENFVFDAASRLLTCLDEQLSLTVGGRVCRACLYPSDQLIPMDVCCECKDPEGVIGHGMAAIRLYRIFPMTGRFPQQDSGPRKCIDAAYGATFELTVYRCVATVQTNGAPPSCDALTMDVAKLMDDAAAMRRSIRCCFATQASDMPRWSGEWAEDDWNPVGPAGGCGGGRMRVTVGFYDDSCDCLPNQLD